MGSIMLKLIIASAIVAAALASSELTEEGYEALWQTFVSDHAKTYQPHEVMGKFAVFKDNVNFINDHNKNHAERLGYTVGINQFADMTSAEFKRSMTGLNAFQSKKQENAVFLDESTAPASVDWTTKNAVTPVKDQGQCGSCWAFSTTGSVEGAYALKNGSIDSFSEQQLVDCAGSYGNQGCNGGLMDYGFQYVKAQGLELESDYGYTARDGTCKYSASKVAFTISGYTDVGQSDAQLAAAVAQQPVSVAIDANPIQFYTSGVFDDWSCGTQLDHGVLAVGYESGYWIVKNSWGANWGESGYFRLARRSTGTGMCGITLQASYAT